MTTSPRASHTRHGIRQAHNATRGTFCDRVGQPDPCCGCIACARYFAPARRR